MQNPNSSNGTSRFTKGKVIISGMDTSKSELFLHIPCERDRGTPRARISKNSSSNSSSLITDRRLTPSLISMSATSFHSILGEDLESREGRCQGQAEATGNDLSPRPSWAWNSREIVVIILVLSILCFNIITQSARNSALKASLRHTRAILEERDRVIDWKSSPNDLSPHFQPAEPQKPGPEEIWWSVVGNGDSHDIGHLKIGLVKIDSPYMGSTCDATNSITDGEHPAGEGQYIDEEGLDRGVESEQKAEKADNEELHKNLAGILLEDNPLVEGVQHILAQVISFLWSLVFGV